jgi:hypothetical protein
VEKALKKLNLVPFRALPFNPDIDFMKASRIEYLNKLGMAYINQDLPLNSWLVCLSNWRLRYSDHITVNCTV